MPTKTTPYQFVIRAHTPDGVFDRDFSIDVLDFSAPVWSTTTGYTSNVDYNTSTAYLIIGPEREKYAITRQWVDYQFVATTSNTSNYLHFYIPEHGGKLPPGLTLSSSGRLTGFINDSLIFDGSQADTGGYDEESYDSYSYDFGVLAYDSIGVPKIYQFKVTVTDGVNEASRYFKILVVSPEMVRNPERIQMKLETSLITTVSNYIPPIQFINGTDLGIARASNNLTIDISGYDPLPESGQVLYKFIPGPDVTSNLPAYLTLDQHTGMLYGYVPYQPAYTTNYSLTVEAIKTFSTYTSISTTTFSLAIKGEVESTIEWVSSATLAPITVGEISESSVIAKQINSDYKIKYMLVDGQLPDGITLLPDGSLAGIPSYTSTGTYNFTVTAQDVYELSAVDKTFKLTVLPYDEKKYTRIFSRPFLSLAQRDIYTAFVSDTAIFPLNSLYRPQDKNFGVQSEFKVVLEFGIEETALSNYMSALRENFYKKTLYFGDIKVAVAKDLLGDAIYEVVYVDIIDNLENSMGKSVSDVVYANSQIYYPNSISNMRKKLESISLDPNTIISVNEYNLPRFMRTPQTGSYQPSGYLHVMPLCYALPGEGAKIVSRIKLSGFNFNQFNFEIDRLIVESARNTSSAKYLLFDRETISDVIADDQLLYGDDGVVLENIPNDPITKF